MVDLHVGQQVEQRRLVFQFRAGRRSPCPARSTPLASSALSAAGTSMPGGGIGRTLSARLSPGPSAKAEVETSTSVASKLLKRSRSGVEVWFVMVMVIRNKSGDSTASRHVNVRGGRMHVKVFAGIAH